MKNETATSVLNFLDIVSDVGPTSHDRVVAYRGHRDISWELLPKIARPPFKGPEAFCLTLGPDHSAESSLFKLFRDYATSLMPASIFLDDDIVTSWRTLIVAQHHGTPTRLLDWTISPLVALFFAVEGPPTNNHDSAVFIITNRTAFTVHGLANAKENGNAPFYNYSDDVGVLRPPLISPRVDAQGSIFTIRKNPGVPIEPDIHITIPYANREQILISLNDLNINRKVLFPDMDGISAYLRWACRLWDSSYGILK